MPANPIRIAVIIGTVRPGSYTKKAANLAIQELNSLDGVTVDVIDPAELDLPFPGVESATASSNDIQERIQNATGVLMTTPEYHGSVSSALKCVIENLGFPSTLAGKPVALLGVAAGVIGAIKSLEQLRSICSHVGAMVLPGVVSVAGVQRVFDEEGRCNDEGTEKRVRGIGRALVDYIRQTS
ncbi:MAG: NAD(P)H-dependent oxidoreductase [bacterium]|nr:NAD(P)H-dependent oxidoreductase [bacterium]